MSKLYIIGLGPGGRENMTLKAIEKIKESQVVVAYKPYLAYVEDLIQDKEIFSTGMRGEVERCKWAIESVKSGKTTCILSTGDAGLYGMAGPIMEMADGIETEVVAGVSSNFAAASELGAPLMHDNACVSLSDLLTPLDLIMKRVDLLGQGDFVVSIYNPRSKGRPDYLDRALDILRKYRSESTPVGIVKNAGREGMEKILTDLGHIDTSLVDMMSMVIVGNSNTYVEDGKMITPRGYRI